MNHSSRGTSPRSWRTALGNRYGNRLRIRLARCPPRPRTPCITRARPVGEQSTLLASPRCPAPSPGRIEPIAARSLRDRQIRVRVAPGGAGLLWPAPPKGFAPNKNGASPARERQPTGRPRRTAVPRWPEHRQVDPASITGSSIFRCASREIPVVGPGAARVHRQAMATFHRSHPASPPRNVASMARVAAGIRAARDHRPHGRRAKRSLARLARATSCPRPRGPTVPQ